MFSLLILLFFYPFSLLVSLFVLCGKKKDKNQSKFITITVKSQAHTQRNHWGTQDWRSSGRVDGWDGTRPVRENEFVSFAESNYGTTETHGNTETGTRTTGTGLSSTLEEASAVSSHLESTTRLSELPVKSVVETDTQMSEYKGEETRMKSKPDVRKKSKPEVRKKSKLEVRKKSKLEKKMSKPKRNRKAKEAEQMRRYDTEDERPQRKREKKSRLKKNDWAARNQQKTPNSYISIPDKSTDCVCGSGPVKMRTRTSGIVIKETKVKIRKPKQLPQPPSTPGNWSSFGSIPSAPQNDYEVWKADRRQKRTMPKTETETSGKFHTPVPNELFSHDVINEHSATARPTQHGKAKAKTPLVKATKAVWSPVSKFNSPMSKTPKAASKVSVSSRSNFSEKAEKVSLKQKGKPVKGKGIMKPAVMESKYQNIKIKPDEACGAEERRKADVLKQSGYYFSGMQK